MARAETGQEAFGIAGQGAARGQEGAGEDRLEFVVRENAGRLRGHAGTIWDG